MTLSDAVVPFRLELQKVELQRVGSDDRWIRGISVWCKFWRKVRRSGNAAQDAADRQDHTGDSK